MSGHALPIDWAAFDPSGIDPPLLAAAQHTWRDRVGTEYRSMQIVARFLEEVLAGGEDLAVARMIVEMVAEEQTHAEICGEMCRALGATPPSPAEVAAPPADLAAVPIRERILASAISMFLVAEAFSVGYLGDLAERCRDPLVSRVLAVIGGDEDAHQAFGPRYVGELLAREAPERRAGWRRFTEKRVAEHLDRARKNLAAPAAPYDEQTLADLGLHSERRIGEVCLATYEAVIAPRLRELDLV